MLAIDTETTGVDPWHGSQPFLVTIFNGEETHWWEWEVNPLTRKVLIPEKEKQEIRDMIRGETLIFQNSKFDVRELEFVGITNTSGGWDWSKIHDTLISSHLINSSQQKGLTFSALFYLGIDLAKFEDKISDHCNAARRYVRTHHPDWRIARKGLEEMPSASGKEWKADMWLPAAIIQADNLEEAQEWRDSVVKYSLADPEATYYLYESHQRIIEKRGHEKLYEERLKVLPIIYEMEANGVTVSNKRMEALIEEYQQTSMKCKKTCVRIAKSYKYELDMPKTGNNASLQEFIFDVMKLPVVEKTKTGKPSLNKGVFPHYLDTLKETSKEGRFIRKLVQKRKVDTAISYIESYKRFMLPYGDGLTSTMFPTLNPVGTSTLRCSSKNPNEQNISKKEGVNLRRAFGPAPGREWWALDYNNLELRIPAYECEEPAMLELFEKPNEPPYFGSYHLLIFSILYPDEFKKHGAKVKDIYKSTLYQWTKNGNFAELYGAVDTNDGKSTADRAFHYPGAQSIVASKLKKKSALNKHWIRFANQKGYVETLPDRTVDPDHGYPLYCKRTKWGQISPTIPLNYHVQGTACWIMQRAEVKVQEYLNKLGSDYFMIMQVHDELVFDFPHKKNKGNLPKINRIRKIMESCGDDVGVVLTCGVDYHPNDWGTTE